MKEIILNKLSSLNCDEIIGRNFKLGEKSEISAIIVKDNNVGFVLDLDLLGIDYNLGKKLQQECQKTLLEIDEVEKVTIILTSKNDRKHQVNFKEQKPIEKLKKKTGNKSKIKGVKKVILVASTKGGVGKSMIATNLAILLNKVGRKVAILDADIYGPSIAHLMNIEKKPVIKDNLILPEINYGVKVMSIAMLIDDVTKAGVWRGAMLTKILDQLINGVNWAQDQEVDYLIIDSPPGTGDVHLSLMEKFVIDSMILVSTPSDVALIDAIKTIDMAQKLDVEILGLVENMSYFEDNSGHKNYIFGENEGKKFAKDNKIKLLGSVPINQDLRSCGDKKRPYCVDNSASKIGFELGKVVDEILSA